MEARDTARSYPKPSKQRTGSKGGKGANGKGGKGDRSSGEAKPVAKGGGKGDGKPSGKDRFDGNKEAPTPSTRPPSMEGPSQQTERGGPKAKPRGGGDKGAGKGGRGGKWGDKGDGGKGDGKGGLKGGPGHVEPVAMAVPKPKGLPAKVVPAQKPNGKAATKATTALLHGREEAAKKKLGSPHLGVPKPKQGARLPAAAFVPPAPK